MNKEAFEDFKRTHGQLGVVAQIDVSYDPALNWLKRMVRLAFWRLTAKQCVRTLMLLPESTLPSNVCAQNVVEFKALTATQRREIRLQNKITLSDKLRSRAVADYFISETEKAKDRLRTLNSKLETA